MAVWAAAEEAGSEVGAESICPICDERIGHDETIAFCCCTAAHLACQMEAKRLADRAERRLDQMRGRRVFCAECLAAELGWSAGETKKALYWLRFMGRFPMDTPAECSTCGASGVVMVRPPLT